MLHLYGSRRNTRIFDRVLRVQDQLGVAMRPVAYSTAFQREEVHTGTLVLTDFDLLHGYELDMVSAMVRAARRHDSQVRVLNDPAVALERTPLLHRLHQHGHSPIEVTRIDLGEVPTSYPVFIRTEDGCGGPETGLLHDEAAFLHQRDELQRAGLSLKRRIAVTYCAEPDRDGVFRKYGAFVIGDHIVPQHVQRSTTWNVKNDVRERTPATEAEELDHLRANPHADRLLELARVAGIQFGRIDYTLVDGQPVVYEINTNPNFPNMADPKPGREDRRDLILGRLAAAFQAIDDPQASGRTIHFDPPMNANHAFVERDPWYRHPWNALRRGRTWRAVARKLGLIERRTPREPTEPTVTSRLIP